MRPNATWHLPRASIPVVGRTHPSRSEHARTGLRARARPRVWLQTRASTYGATALLVVEVVFLLSAMIWGALSGDEVELGPSSQVTTEVADTQYRPGPGDHRRESVVAAPQLAPRTDPAPTSAPATTISGTALALTLIAVVHAIGFLVLRALRRRGEAPEGRPSVRCRIDDVSAEQEHDDAQSLEDEALRPAEGDARQSDTLEVTTAGSTPKDVSGASGAGSVPTAAGEPGGTVGTHMTADRLSPSPVAAVEPRVERAEAATMRPASAGVPPRATNNVVVFDRRLSRRVAFVSEAWLHWPGHDIACTTVDLSMRGVRCDLAPALPPESLPSKDSSLHVTLTVNGTQTVLRARVGWLRVEENGTAIGLQFVKVPQSDEAVLQGAVISGSPV